MTLRMRGLLVMFMCMGMLIVNRTLILAQDATPSTGAIALVTLGDSLTEGEGNSLELGGYPGRLLTLLAESHPDSTLTNVGHSGWNSDALINGDQGLPSELDQAVKAIGTAVDQGQPVVALVWIGSNDLFYLYEYGDPDAAAETDDLTHYEGNLRTIVSTLQKAGAHVVLARLDDQSQRPVTQGGLAFTGISKAEIKQMGQQVTRYNDVIAKTAADLGATTVDFYNTTIFTDATTLADDGNHPNPDGYDLVAQIWLAAIEPALNAQPLPAATAEVTEQAAATAEATAATTQEAASDEPQLLNATLLKDTSVIDDKPCAAPCWHNITPGTTSMEEARTIIAADTQFGAINEAKDPNSAAHALVFGMKEATSPCCRVYSTADGVTVAQILTLLAPDQVMLGDVIAKYGTPTSAAGGDITPDQAIVTFIYPTIPLTVYAFAPGVKEGTLTEKSPVIAVLYLRTDDLANVMQMTGLQAWPGYGPLASWLGSDTESTIQATAEATIAP